MCTVSMVMDHYSEKWGPYTVPGGTFPNTGPPFAPWVPPPISPAEIEEFRKLLDRAREYDKRNGEPECELEEKKETLRQIAKLLKIELPAL